LTETAAIVVLVIGVFLGIEAFGLIGTGVGYFAAYAVYLPIVYWLARRRIGFRLHPDVFWISVVSLLSASGVAILGVWSSLPAAIVGVVTAVFFGIYGLARLSHKADLHHLVERLGWPFNRIIGLFARYGN
jgi:PST family polysaccharide transporter